MYPNLYFFFKDVFGVDLPVFKFVNSFGFFVALSFIAAAIVLTKELRRREGLGWLSSTDATITVGKGVEWSEVILNAFFGFLIGFKLVGAFLQRSTALENPQAFILSSQGSLGAGILLALILGGLKYYEGTKQKLDKPEKRNIRIWPHDRIGDMTILAFIFGFLGAKLFHNLENWHDLVRDPIGALTSFSGLTFYGGLICATLAIAYYARKHKIDLWHLADAFGPAMMIAYAIGRIGCQVAGDGDWGIPNSAYVTDAYGKSIAATPAEYEATVQKNLAFYENTLREVKQIKAVADVPHDSFIAPSWLPNWAVAYAYPHNVISEGIRMNGCEGQYCYMQPVPVYPTPFYETLMGLALFAFLWVMRKRINKPGLLAGLYLVVNGIERFVIENIRVNDHYRLGPLYLSQAQWIALGLIAVGVFIMIIRSRQPELVIKSQLDN